MKSGAFVSALDESRIVAAIKEAESRSRGEIRVHVSQRSVEDAHAAAVALFDRLGMAKTDERNGVLLFVAPESRAFAVIGDRGIHERCGEAFWPAVAEAVRAEFSAGRYTQGIIAGVEKMGEELARHFPRRRGDTDRNELPDSVSRD
jgi:uncharacterized membrane protein